MSWRMVSSFNKSSINSQKAVIPLLRMMTALPGSQILGEKNKKLKQQLGICSDIQSINKGNI